MVKKIDFHVHTISCDKDYEFSYSSRWIKKYVQEAKLNAIAITNHDLFDEENFNKVKQDIPNVKLFPGIELSLDQGHVNIIFSEDDIPNLVRFSDWLDKQDLGECGKISTEDYCEWMKNWQNGIYIFEMGKSNSLSVPERLSQVTAVGGVSNQLKFQSFYKKNFDLVPVLFSDAHASDDEPDKTRNDIEILRTKNTFLQIDNCSFDEIKNCITDRTKVGINETYLNDVINIGSYTVSTGLNLIVGKRGTGKTEFLKSIRKLYDSEDIYEIAQFETSKSDEYIERQRKDQGHSSFNNWKNQYSTQFYAIQDYLEKEDEGYDREVEEFLKSVKKFAEDSTASKSTAKYQLIKETNFENISTRNLEKYLTNLVNLINSTELWTLLINPQSKKKIFIETYNELRALYIEKRKKNEIQKEVNGILNSVKKIVQSKTGITPVSDCEFSKIIQINQTEKAIEEFLATIIKDKELKRENLYGYQIIVKLAPFSNAEQFRKDVTTKEAVQTDLIIPYHEKDYIKFLKNLKKKKFFKISNLADYFLHLDVQLLDSDGTPASGGQAVGFALIMRLEEAKNKPIILIDEPEASLDNAYIREELIKALKYLTKYSTVFVVTHNSTLGALLEPDYLIVTTKNDEKEYNVLTGEFSSHLISDSSEGSESSYDKFVEAMEAGIEAYNRKGEIYESLRG